MEVTVWRQGQEFSQTFSKGVPQGPVASRPLPEDQQARQGTRVRYRYDKTIFKAPTIMAGEEEDAAAGPKQTERPRRLEYDPRIVGERQAKPGSWFSRRRSSPMFVISPSRPT